MGKRIAGEDTESKRLSIANENREVGNRKEMRGIQLIF